VAAAILVGIGQAIAISQAIQATLGDTSNTLYTTSLRQLQITTFLHVAVAAIALWLVLLGRRAGFMLAVILGVLTLLLFAISITSPADPGPPLAPPWLHAVGVLAAVIMTAGGALALRVRRGSPHRAI
jgi:Na+-translocating ferredoxin:NAD+ oxidoreductase RnfD subunit